MAAAGVIKEILTKGICDSGHKHIFSKFFLERKLSSYVTLVEGCCAWNLHLRHDEK